MDPQSIRHLHALRSFIRNLVEQAERSGGCECHRPPSLLLVGPPGAGKTFLVKQMSTVCEMPLFGVHTHQLTGPNSLRSLFNQARELDYPSLFFLDDIDHIISNHDKTPGHSALAEALRQELYSQLGYRKLKIFDPNSKHNPVKDFITTPCNSRKASGTTTGTPDDSPDNNGLILVAATSSPWLLYKDHELLSRFRGVYLVGLPDKETRFHLIKSLLQKVQHNLSEKDIWLVAEKTEGYTPSDLMVVIKNLNYKQFAFLLSMAGMTGFQESSDNDSDSSSEMTESDTETDSNDDETRDSMDQLSDGKLSQSDNAATPVARSISSGKHSTNSSTLNQSEKKDGSLNKLEADWASDEDVENRTRKLTAFSSTPKKDSIVKLGLVAASDIDLTDLNQTNDNNDDAEMKMINEALNDLDKACGSELESKLDSSVSPDCDNNAHDVPVMSNPTVPEEMANRVSEVGTENNTPAKDEMPKVSNLSFETANGEDETKSIEFHLFEPPDPMRNDNQTVDSGSESDKEDGVLFPRRSRRVNFSDPMPSMSPLMIDIDSIVSGNSIDYIRSGSIATTLEEKLLGKSSYGGADPSNNILKRLLSSSPPLHGEDDLKSLGLDILKNETTKDDLVMHSKESHHTIDLIGMYGEVENSEATAGRSVDQVDFVRNILGAKSDDRLRLRRSLSPGSSESRVIDGRRSMSLGGSPQITPLGSDISCNLAIDNVSGIGRQSRNGVSSSRDDEINKTHDSDSPTTPSSVVSTGTCNMSGETLECHSDTEERFRNLDDDLKNEEKGNLSEEEMSNGDNEASSLQAFFNLNNLGEVSIKIITLEDVLGIVSRTKRSVTDAEIKKYTDFMVWFAEVAKSACPHNSKGSTAGGSSVASESIASSSWEDTPQFNKKRKGPLHKLGRFLLKALMLLLD